MRVSDREMVLARYPRAAATSDAAHHRIVEGSSELGRGASEAAAWSDAARRLRADPASVEETPAEVMGLPQEKDQKAPDIEGGQGGAVPGSWPEGE